MAPDPLLLIGGTFDPPHIGHLLLAECAVHDYGGRAVLLPAGDPWRKRTGAVGERRTVTAAGTRLEMLRLACAAEPHLSVDDREVRRSGPSYTVDTLEELRAEGHEDIVLVLGSDALADLPNWKQPGRIRELARLAIARKPGEEVVVAEGVSTIASMPLLPISSTLVRQRVREGLPIRHLVPLGVEEYIRERDLYRA